MKILQIINIIAVIILFIGVALYAYTNVFAHSSSNSGNNQTDDKQQNTPFSLDVSDTFLKTKDSTKMSLIADASSDYSKFKYEWAADIGEIEEDGPEAVYTAPEKPGTATINVTVKNGKEVVYSDSASIEIYNQFIILQAGGFVSDYGTTSVPSRWIRFVDYIKDENITASISLTPLLLARGTNNVDDDSDLINYLKNISEMGCFELWNNGYDYEQNDTSMEFFNTSYEYQKEHLLKTQDFAKEKLNVTLHTFGAPYNAADKNTVKALEEIQDIKVWISVGKPENPESEKIFTLIKTGCSIDVKNNYGPDYNSFVKDYSALKCSDKDYLVLQISPNEWTDAGFDEFKEIVDFLNQKNVTFINPYDYYLLLKDYGELQNED